MPFSTSITSPHCVGDHARAYATARTDLRKAPARDAGAYPGPKCAACVNAWFGRAGGAAAEIHHDQQAISFFWERRLAIGARWARFRRIPWRRPLVRNCRRRLKPPGGGGGGGDDGGPRGGGEYSPPPAPKKEQRFLSRARQIRRACWPELRSASPHPICHCSSGSCCHRRPEGRGAHARWCDHVPVRTGCGGVRCPRNGPRHARSC